MIGLKPNIFFNHTNTKFITTPIYYANGHPHLGHVYSTLVADTMSRWYKLRGNNVIFSTGVDEHGQKIFEIAQKNNSSPQDWCDHISASFQNIFHEADISYTHFVRTTDSVHKQYVKNMWNRMKDDISVGDHSGWYSTQEESFIPETLLTKAKDGTFTTENGQPVHWLSEPNYLFNLEKYQSTLLEWVQNNPFPPIPGLFPNPQQIKDSFNDYNFGNRIFPNAYEKEITSYISNPQTFLSKLSISRPKSRMPWGIPVPSDPEHVLYVWLDALVNYITASGIELNDFPQHAKGENSSPSFHNIWPPTIQILGKDILRFHAAFWPAFLKSASLPLPTQLLVHGHWTVDGVKMSKSLGNIVDPQQELVEFGSDPFRFFLLTSHSLENDSNYSQTDLKTFNNAHLAGNIGNLVGRVLSKQIIPSLDEFSQGTEPVLSKSVKSFPLCNEEKNLIEYFDSLKYSIHISYCSGNFYGASKLILESFTKLNKYWSEREPWNLAKVIKTQSPTNSLSPERQSLQIAFKLTFECIRVLTHLLSPLIPKLSQNIREAMGLLPISPQTDFDSILSYCHVDAKEHINFPSPLKGPLVKKFN